MDPRAPSGLALRFLTAMSVAPAAVAACRASEPAREPVNELAALEPLTTDARVASVEPTADEPPAPPCGRDEFFATRCISIDPLGNPRARPTSCPARVSSKRLDDRFAIASLARNDEAAERDLADGTCCYVWCQRIEAARVARTCPPPREEKTTCFPMPSRGTSLPAAPPFDRCPDGTFLHNVVTSAPSRARFDPDASTLAGDGGAAECCYAACVPHLTQRAIVVPGRPARDDDHGIAIARSRLDVTWSGGTCTPPAGGFTVGDALLEHASIAAFARLSLSLLAFGAPPDLVAGAHEAALDEIRHARIAFRRVGGGLGPDACPTFGELRAHRTLGDLAEETYRDGCIGETLASLELRATARCDRELVTIAEDEERHALLAWRIVEWTIAEGGTDVRERVERAARELRMPDEALASWARTHVIEPCTRALLCSETA